MFKVLILSDIHIGEYRTHNENNFRINQFNKLKTDLVRLIRCDNVKEVWISGDILREAQPKPNVMHFVKDFIEALTAECHVRMILGNHDVMVRNADTELSEFSNNSLITLLEDNDNLFIYYDDVINIDNKSVHFHSWIPNNSFEVRKADYLVCHGDVDKELSPFSDNYINVNAYKKAFCGHIHIYKESEHYISLGVPFQHSFSDDINTGVVVYDLDSDTFEHKFLDGYLQFKYVKNVEEVQEQSDELSEVRVKTENISEELKDINLTDLNLSPSKSIEQFTDTLSDDAKAVINKIVNKQYNTDDKPTDLRFEIKTVKAKNFLSIKSLDFNFDKFNGLTVIKGLEGSGKSTLFNLIEFMFFGKLKGYSKSDYSSVFKDGKKLECSMELRYQNSDYKIERTLTELRFYKNGKTVDSNRKGDLQSELETELDFLRFWNLIYIKQFSSGIFSEMSDTSRVSLMSNLIGLNIINTWTTELTNKITNLKDSIKSDSDDQIRVQTKIDELTSFINENKDVVYIDINTIKNEISDKSNQISVLNTNINNNNKEISDNSSKITVYKQMIDDYLKKQTQIKELTNQARHDKETLVKFKAEVDSLQKREISDLTDLTSKLNVINCEYNSKLLEQEQLRKELEKYEKHPNICPTCGQDWVIPNRDEMIENLNKKILSFRFEDYLNARNKLNEKIKSINDDIKYNQDIDSKKSEYDLKVQKLKLLVQKINDMRSDINQEQLNNEITRLTDLNTALESKNTEIINNRNSIQSQINELNQRLGSITISNQIYEKVQFAKDNLEGFKLKLQQLNTDISATNDLVSELLKFNTKVLSDKGLLVASLLKKVSEYLNTDKDLKVETIHELQNGSLRPTLNIKLFVKQYNTYVDYAMLSGGQALLADLKFLKGITETLGSVSIMFLDEIFKFFSPDTVKECLTLLDEINVNKVFLILHGDYEVDSKIINVILDKDKGSIYY